MRARILYGGLFLCSLAPWSGGCADPCTDDGLGQDKCVADSTSQSGTESTTGQDTSAGPSTLTTTGATATTSTVTTQGTASMSGTSVTATDTDTSTATGSSTGGLQLYCLDMDGDGFGDPDACVMDDEPPPGHVPNDEDCDDSDPDTYPGAAEDEDPNACMNDSDDDGWGDPDVPGGVVPGSDCHDDNPDLNPGDNLLLAFEDGEIWEIDPASAAVSVLAPVAWQGMGPWNVISATVRDDGVVYVTNSSQQELATVDYSMWCSDGVTPAAVTELPDPHQRNMCGLTFGLGGTLVGLDSGNDEIVTLDPMTGEVVSGVELVDQMGGEPIDVGTCAMAFDCIDDRILYADGSDGDIYAVDPQTGESELLADTDGSWSPNGMAFDPVTRTVFVAGTSNLYQVEIDGSNMIVDIGPFDMGGNGAQLSDIGFLPGCGG